MEWTGAIILWTLAGLVLVAWIADKLWRALGRRRTEARLRTKTTAGRVVGRHERPDLILDPSGSGATSSERSRKPSATDGNTRGR